MSSRKRRASFLLLTAVLLGGCGGGDDGTGFLVRAKVRGINIFAISQMQFRFESAGDARFGSESGSEAGVSYATEDGGRVFTATGNSAWVTDEYDRGASEFIFEMPFVNPDGGGETDLQVVIHRDIEGEMVLAGHSVPMTVELPAEAGAVFEPVVGCVEGGPCGQEPPEPEQ